MRFRGLAFRFGAIFLLGAVAIFTIAFLFTFRYTRSILLEEAEREAKFLTQLTIARLEMELKPLEQVPRSLVAMMDPSLEDPYRTLLSTQHSILSNSLVFGSCVALEPYSAAEGTTYYAHYIFETSYGIGSKFLGGETYDYFEKDWYRLPKETGTAMWIGPYYDDGGGDTLMCTYSVPFFRTYNGENRFAGVLTLDVSLTALSDIVRTVQVPEVGYVLVIASDGRLITSPVPSYLNRNIREVAVKRDDESRRIIDNMLAGSNGFAKMSEMRTEDPSWVYFAPMPSTGWRVAVIFPQEALFADLYDFLWRLLTIFVASVAAILVTVIVVSRNLTRPLKRLSIATRQIGDGDFHVPIPAIHSTTEVGDLARSFTAMQGALTEYIANLKSETTAREKIESELGVARSIQMGLLPATFPDHSRVDLYAELIPAREIGGDLYDFFFIDVDHLFFAVGDVSGKGVPASLFMAITRTLFRSLVSAKRPIEQTVAMVNEELCKENPSAIFVTFLAGMLKLDTGALQFCNAGHNAPLLRSVDGTVKRIPIRTNIPLGIMPEQAFETDRLCLRPGEQLVLYSDGITEAESTHSGLFGEARLTEAAGERGRASSAQLAGRIMDSVRSFCLGAEQSDDITLMILTAAGDTDTCELILRNDIGELHSIRETLVRLSAEWKMKQGIAAVLNLVLEELFTNIVFYGFDDNAGHLVRILISREGEELVITIEDDGKPFNILESAYKGFGATLEEKQIGGEGIHLVKELMESISYSREQGLNRVVMKKKME